MLPALSQTYKHFSRTSDCAEKQLHCTTVSCRDSFPPVISVRNPLDERRPSSSNIGNLPVLSFDVFDEPVAHEERRQDFLSRLLPCAAMGANIRRRRARQAEHAFNVIAAVEASARKSPGRSRADRKRERESLLALVEDAALGGNGQAQFILGIMFLEGRGEAGNYINSAFS